MKKYSSAQVNTAQYVILYRMMSTRNSRRIPWDFKGVKYSSLKK